VRRLILRSFQSPGDIVMLTAAVRDLHAANPGQFETDVRTAADALWENNPHLTRLNEGTPGVEVLDMHYPIVHESNRRPYHFIHGYPQFLEQQLGVRVPVTQFRGDIHLSPEEKSSTPLNGHPLPDRFWIIIAGGKYDFTAKWWNPASYQKVVDHFQGRLQFLQCGEEGHWHPKLNGVINLIGKTDTRQFVRLMHHADGVVCAVTFAMHLAAAIETRPGRRTQRPCVVIAGGREPSHWEAYSHHQYISTTGMLSCCQEGGCWKSRCQLVGDGDQKDQHDVCEQPVQLTPELRIPRCLDMITADDVIRRIELYLEGETTAENSVHHSPPLPQSISKNASQSLVEAPRASLARSWDELPGLAREISVGADGSIWCLGMGEFPRGFSIHRWNNDHWDHIEGAAVRIAVGVNGEIWTVDRNHEIRAFGTDVWNPRSGLAREIAAGADGSVWSVGADNIAPGGAAISIRSGDDWRHIDGAAVKIAIGPDGPWILNSAGQIFRRSGEGWELLPGLACEIALSSNGCAWCLSQAELPGGGHSIHRWNGTDWDHVDGTAIKIAAGPDGTVLIVDPQNAIFRRTSRD
jgi:ADP-heptose:LPS heptosyltransferase